METPISIEELHATRAVVRDKVERLAFAFFPPSDLFVSYLLREGTGEWVAFWATVQWKKGALLITQCACICVECWLSEVKTNPTQSGHQPARQHSFALQALHLTACNSFLIRLVCYQCPLVNYIL